MAAAVERNPADGEEEEEEVGEAVRATTEACGGAAARAALAAGGEGSRVPGGSEPPRAPRTLLAPGVAAGLRAPEEGWGSGELASALTPQSGRRGKWRGLFGKRRGLPLLESRT